MNILMVLTTHEELGATGYKTGVWLEELTTPYLFLSDAGVDISLASPLGGPAPVDPRSYGLSTQSASARRFGLDRRAKADLSDTLRLDQLYVADFDGAFYPGGPGAMWDLAENMLSASIIATLLTAGRPVALVGYGVGALQWAADSSACPLVKGRAVTGPSNSEERAQGLAGILPFSLEDELIRLGGHYRKSADGVSHVVRDGLLITAQNTASSLDAASLFLGALR